MPTASRFARPIPAPSGGLGAMFQSPAGGPPPPAPPPAYAHLGAGDSAASVPAPPLYLVFDNQKYRIDKDQFIIGRGSKSSDLPIKDGNISRRHAAIVLQNGAFYMKDLGSTNGIEFNGERVDSRKIEEGDVYQLCDYELRFTYR
jgi:hypothetical protein